jgi:hypothetical protein
MDDTISGVQGGCCSHRLRPPLYCFKPPFPSGGGFAAASAGRSGPLAPCSRTVLNSDLRSADRRPNSHPGRPLGARPHPLWKSSRSPDAAFKGPLRRPAAALDRCFSRPSSLAPYESSLSQAPISGGSGRDESTRHATAQLHRLVSGPGVTSPKSRPSGCRADHAGHESFPSVLPDPFRHR